MAADRLFGQTQLFPILKHLGGMRHSRRFERTSVAHNADIWYHNRVPTGEIRRDGRLGASFPLLSC